MSIGSPVGSGVDYLCLIVFAYDSWILIVKNMGPEGLGRKKLQDLDSMNDRRERKFDPVISYMILIVIDYFARATLHQRTR